MANRRSTGWCARREPDLPELVALATGTEVHMLRSSDVLEAEGIATRVVSMPCVENFAAQDDDYRDRVLPLTLSIVVVARGVRHARLTPLGREACEAIGMPSFGASAPAGPCTGTLASRRRRSPTRGA